MSRDILVFCCQNKMENYFICSTHNHLCHCHLTQSYFQTLSSSCFTHSSESRFKHDKMFTTMCAWFFRRCIRHSIFQSPMVIKPYFNFLRTLFVGDEYTSISSEYSKIKEKMSYSFSSPPECERLTKWSNMSISILTHINLGSYLDENQNLNNISREYQLFSACKQFGLRHSFTRWKCVHSLMTKQWNPISFS